MDVLRRPCCSPELPTERTRLLDNLGRVRREVGPITPELSDALADHMNIRRGEVHEVVSFYSFLQVPIDAVRVCTGPVCDCFGARELLAQHAGAIEVACLGHCDLAPVLTRGDEIVPEVTHATNDGPVLGLAQRDETLDDYAARGGLELLASLPPRERIVEELKAAGLTGYGGAGFPAGIKWEAVANEPGPRYVVVNADEGEPGTIKDRYVLELRPHLFLEGVLVAMRFAEAEHAWIYLREEYAGSRGSARARARGARAPRACSTARDRARHRRRRVHRRRGDRDARVDGGPPRDAAAPPALPRAGRLPRPADPDQQRRDARAHPRDPAERRRVVGGARDARARAARGSGRSPEPSRGRAATRRRTGSRPASSWRSTPAASSGEIGAVVPGGAASGILPPQALDAPLTRDGLREWGAGPGSAAVQVFPASYSPLRLLAETMRFFAEESCQKCTPCRIGNRALHHLCEELEHGRAAMTREKVDEWLLAMEKTSICGLGQAAPFPVRNAMRWWPELFEPLDREFDEGR